MPRRDVGILFIVVVLVVSTIWVGCERVVEKKVSNLEFGRESLAGGKADQSIEYLEKALKETPGDPEVLAYLTLAYKRAQNETSAKVAGNVEKYARKESEMEKRLLSKGVPGARALLEIMFQRNRLMIDAMKLLVKMGDAGATVLADFLVDPHERARYGDIISMAKQALIEIGVPASPIVCAKLNNPNSGLSTEVMKDLIEVLGQISSKDAETTLESCAQQTDPVIRMEAVISLYNLGKKEYSKQIIDGLNSRNPEVRRIASNALNNINDVPMSVLISKIDDPDPTVRANIIRKLSENPPKSLQNKLMNMLSSDPSDDVKDAIMEVLKHYGDSVAQGLIDMLENEELWQTRLRIIQILKDPSVSKGVKNEDQLRLYNMWQNEPNKIVKDHLAQFLNQTN